MDTCDSPKKHRQDGDLASLEDQEIPPDRSKEKTSENKKRRSKSHAGKTKLSSSPTCVKSRTQKQ